MIEVEDVNHETSVIVYSCAECGVRFGAPIVYRWKAGTHQAGLKAFFALHASCGDLEFDAHCGGTEEECEWNTVKIRAIYEENPGIKFDEVRRIYRGEKHEETKDDVEGSNVDRDRTDDRRELEQSGTDDEVERVFG